VSVFGPGKGESIVVHLGDGRWIVVDSCIDQRTKSIPALEYLLSLGVDAASQVDLVVATHAHNDHFAGISRVYEQCLQAKFVWSMAATTEEFAALVELDDDLGVALRPSAFSEYRTVVKIATDRQQTMGGLRQMKYAAQDRSLFERSETATSPAVSVRALSPSDQAIHLAQSAHAALAFNIDAPRRVIQVDPNKLAVALWIRSGDRSVLLGADLPNGPDGCGWSAVLETFLPNGKASLIKIPHHGSPNAHMDQVWKQLLSKTPVAVVTPYRGSPTPRPSDSDVARMNGLTEHVYTTAPTKLPSRSRRTGSTASALQGLAGNVRDIWGSVGHVRCRSRVGAATWDVVTYSPAVKLSVSIERRGPAARW